MENKGKTLTEKLRDLHRKGTHKHMETYFKYFASLSQSEESKCMCLSSRDLLIFLIRVSPFMVIFVLSFPWSQVCCSPPHSWPLQWAVPDSEPRETWGCTCWVTLRSAWAPEAATSWSTQSSHRWWKIQSASIHIVHSTWNRKCGFFTISSNCHQYFKRNILIWTRNWIRWHVTIIALTNIVTALTIINYFYQILFI